MKKRYNSCRVERRVLVTTSDLFTGLILTKEWRNEPCGSPLFKDEHQETGVCWTCADGWRHPENYPTDGGLKTIASVVS